MPRLPMPVATLACLSLAGAGGAGEPPNIDLAIHYVGNAGTDRAAAFVAFLESRFATVAVGDREHFEPASAAGADVVLLDWSQRDRKPQVTRIRSPLGERETWDKPTVLLDSAGLLLAAPWQLAGAYG